MSIQKGGKEMREIGKRVMLLDGGMGSELERAGVEFTYPEELNVTHPELIRSIHQSYAAAGAELITANTFGLNRIKYKGERALGELLDAAIANARTAKGQVMLDIGPTGAMLRPLGQVSFDEAYEAFREVVQLTCDRVDGYILETFSDLYELKAAVLAVKENSTRPVFATMTFDRTARTLTGSTPEIMVALLEGLGVDALGINCSLGPAEMEPVVQRLLAAAHIPVILQPNRGLPSLRNGKTEYALGVEEFASCMKKYAEMGVSVIGGCCGTTPEFIKALSPLCGLPVKRPQNPHVTAVTSYSRYLELRDVTVCGERLNPTGKKKIKEALLDRNYDLLVAEGIAQQEAGAELLDVNVGLPKLDEPAVMRELCERLQEYIDLPLQIDSSNREALEAGARYYNGVPLINSVNGERAVLEAVLPIAKKYGAVVLGLTMDEGGIPKTAEERVAIAERIIKAAESYGIPRHRVMIDTLVLTASAEQSLVRETLRALTLVRALGVKTALGVSNVSFGLPNRPLINRTFLSMAMQAGLTMPILNPLDGEMMGAVHAWSVLSGRDVNSEHYIELYQNVTAAPTAAAVGSSGREVATADSLFEAVRRGLKVQSVALTAAELEVRDPMELIDRVLIAALNEVGRDYAAGKLFLPQLIASAEAAKAAFEVITERLPARAVAKETVLLATVKGDVHDIGKNIVKTVLASYGYRVIDLGRDVAPERVVEAWREHRPFAVGLSALMTTTVPSMEATIAALRAAGCRDKIFVGGAVITAELAKEIGADCYTADALEMVRTLERLI